MDNRLPWDEYFMQIAYATSTRATCERGSVGAVLVRDKAILSTGYNGSARGLPHCDEAGCMIEDNHCTRTVHAEINAVAQAAKVGTSVEKSALYVTSLPCWRCFVVLVNAGVNRIYYNKVYRPDDRVFEWAGCLGIPLVNVNMEDYDVLEP